MAFSPLSNSSCIAFPLFRRPARLADDRIHINVALNSPGSAIYCPALCKTLKSPSFYPMLRFCVSRERRRIHPGRERERTLTFLEAIRSGVKQCEGFKSRVWNRIRGSPWPESHRINILQYCMIYNFFCNILFSFINHISCSPQFTSQEY